MDAAEVGFAVADAEGEVVDLTRDSLVGLEFWGWFFVGIPWCWGCAGTLSGR